MLRVPHTTEATGVSIAEQVKCGSVEERRNLDEERSAGGGGRQLQAERECWKSVSSKLGVGMVL
jgi:hypothetical protein